MGFGSIALLVAVAAVLPVPGRVTAAAQYQRHGAEFCNCPRAAKPVCGRDQQTYINECVMGCASQQKLKDGVCDPDCYPPGSNEQSNWDSTQPVCVVGLTYMNAAEAMYDGYPRKCMRNGICTYAWVNGKAVSWEPTTGGKRKSVKAAAANTQWPSKGRPNYPYNEALTKALIFYDSQISGMIEPSYKRLAWRGNSCFSCKGRYGEDLSGGFYESGGSTLKLGVISAYTPALLALGALYFPQGYQKAGLMDDIKFKVKWGADFLIKSHVQPYVYMGSMGNHTEDFDNFAPHELYEAYAPRRPVGYCTKTNPCAEIVADAAAALAAAYQLLKADNPSWAANALSHARQLYKFATEYPETYVGTTDPALMVHWYLYWSDGLYDELAFAAAMLFRATGESRFRRDADRYFKRAMRETPDYNTLEAGQLKPATAVVMAQLDPSNRMYANEAKAFFDNYLNMNIRHTPCGLAVPYHWGALTHGPNVAMLGMIHGKNKRIDERYRARLFNYGQHQVDYVLGDCGRSWMVGFGEKYPKYLHHEASYNSYLVWSNTSDPLGVRIPGTYHLGPYTVDKTDRPQTWQKGKLDFEGNYFPQRHIAYGTMFGAPLMNDGMILSRKDYTYSEPTIVYATSITGALAGLSEYYGLGAWSGELLEVNPVNYRSYL